MTKAFEDVCDVCQNSPLSQPHTGVITDSRPQVSTSSEAIDVSDALNTDVKVRVNRSNVYPVAAIQNISGVCSGFKLYTS